MSEYAPFLSGLQGLLSWEEAEGGLANKLGKLDPNSCSATDLSCDWGKSLICTLWLAQFSHLQNEARGAVDL